MTAMVRPQRDESLRNNGLGMLLWGLDPLAGSTQIPNGTAWTPIKLWQQLEDTFPAKTSQVLDSGRVLRIPRRYWGQVLTGSSMSGRDESGGTVTWELAIGIGLDLVNNPALFLFGEPQEVPVRLLGDANTLGASFPTGALITTEIPDLVSAPSIDLAYFARHNGTSRAFTPLFADGYYIRIATHGSLE